MSDFERDNKMAKKIAIEVDKKGGKTFYVGGLVRDKILGKDNKDIDIEIHGITFDALRQILESLGHIDERKVGDNFGILALKGYDIDIAMPRSEKPTNGGGHKDFIIETDPFIGYENAARRRDFTINAMMENVLTGEILDYFGGRADLENGIIRHVDANTFKDDPLRVLRAAQFASRFGFIIADDTTELAKTMDLSQLSRERIAGELDKALLKSDKPSIFFNELRKMNQLSVWFPEVFALIGCDQEPTHHPEGDVYNHTMLVLDEATTCRKYVSNPRYFMVAALCHDFGKPLVSKYDSVKNRITAIDHQKTGVPLAADFVKRIYNENDMLSYVKNMVLLHMEPTLLLNNTKSKHKSYMKMFDSCIEPNDLILLAKCDHDGRAMRKDFDEKEAFLREKLASYNDLMSKPHVLGKDLIDRGYVPGPKFKEILEYAHNCHLAGLSKDIVLNQIRGTFGGNNATNHNEK